MTHSWLLANRLARRLGHLDDLSDIGEIAGQLVPDVLV